MLTITIFTTLLLLLISPSNSSSPPPLAPPPSPTFVNLTDILSLAGPFHTFLSLLNSTQTIQSLQTQANNTNQGLTLFTPSDAAFSSLSDPSPLANLSDNQLQSLLLTHALPQFYTLTDMVKNLSGQAVSTMAGGGQFSLNVTDNSGLVGLDSGPVRANISSSVYSADPVAIYQVDQVLLPKAIFGDKPIPPVAAPPSEPRSPPPSGSADAPPSDSGNGEEGHAPGSSKTDNGVSASYGNRFDSVVACFVLVVSGGTMMML